MTQFSRLELETPFVFKYKNIFVVEKLASHVAYENTKLVRYWYGFDKRILDEDTEPNLVLL